MTKITSILLTIFFTVVAGSTIQAQDQDLLKLVKDSANDTKKQ